VIGGYGCFAGELAWVQWRVSCVALTLIPLRLIFLYLFSTLEPLFLIITVVNNHRLWCKSNDIKTTYKMFRKKLLIFEIYKSE